MKVEKQVDHRGTGWLWPMRLTMPVALGVLTALYLLVFQLTDDAPILSHLLAAMANAVPVVLAGWAMAAWVAPMCWPVSGWRRWLTVALALPGYALLIYIATIVLLAVFGGDSARTGGLFISYFQGPAFVWQCLQGLAYGIISLLSGWLLLSERMRLAAAAPIDSAAAPAPLGRLLLRTEAGIVPVEADAIIRIAAADDYCEVVLATARHLARMSISECERLLANEPMVRIHRSHLINLRCLVSAEPTGDGRLQLTLSNGDQLTTSRTGARLIREQSG
jgi:LytTr DNA-binding domain